MNVHRYLVRSIMVLVIGAFVFGGVAVSSVTAQDATPETDTMEKLTSTSNVYGFPLEVVYWPGEQIPGATSTYVAYEAGISGSIHTTGLTPGHAVTMWWVVFNHPENCTNPTVASRCGEGDILVSGGDESVDGNVLYASGHVIGPDGEGNFGAYLGVGDDSGIVLMGGGLTNPLGADVHLVVRDHGPADGALLGDQLSTFGGGCSNAPEGTGTAGDYECNDIQFAVHEPTLESDM